MKAVFSFKEDRLTSGIASSFQACDDVDVIYWTPGSKATMDMFDEIQPDVLVCETSLFGPEMSIAASRYPNARIIGIGKESDAFIPSLLITNEQSNNCPVLPPVGAANIAQINRGNYESVLSTHILSFTDDINIGSKVGEILDEVCSSYQTKLYGKQKINLPNYLGNMEPRARSNALASSQIYLDLDGETWFDACVVGTIPLVFSEKPFGEPVRTFKNSEELHGHIKEIEEQKEDKSNFLKAFVYGRTYFDFAASIFSFFNMHAYADQLQIMKKALL